MDVSLSPELEKIISAHLAAGAFKTPGDVIRAGLLSLDFHGLKPDFVYTSEAELRSMLLDGISQLDAGEGIPGEVAKKDLLLRTAGGRTRDA